ncbi:MAG: BON domain-containing protein [Burkholderiales bacterium]|nr:BON domain-containing protein [Burkholderiales bacterium]
MRAAIVMMMTLSAALSCAADDNPFNDPFEQATAGYPGCEVPVLPKMSDADLRREAHQRHERGTSCWLAGQCEAGGPYKHDAEINAAIVSALKADKRFERTSLWVETVRGYVTVHGCVRSKAQQRTIEQFVKPMPRVLIVWDQTHLGKHPLSKAKP